VDRLETIEGLILERPVNYGTEVYSPPRHGRMSESEDFLAKVEEGVDLNATRGVATSITAWNVSLHC
jgi:hypothetical protein